jgi:hypothetical protein
LKTAHSAVLEAPRQIRKPALEFEPASDENIGNNIAILNHARVLVEEGIRTASDDQTLNRLTRLKERIDREISTLDATEKKSVQPTSLVGNNVGAVAVACAGVGLVTLGAYLLKQRANSTPRKAHQIIESSVARSQI